MTISIPAPTTRYLPYDGWVEADRIVVDSTMLWITWKETSSTNETVRPDVIQSNGLLCCK